MADAATISVTATMLPDEIAKTIDGSMTVTPSDANHKWYYKLTSVTNSSNDMIGGYYSNYTALADSTAPQTVAVTDTVAFLWIQRLGLTLAGSIHAISSASTVTCIVCAMFDDVSV